ncbi:linear amide C-N hydrolase [Prosthecochloris sp. SCSIO W1103]|uniref:linear amide C-N hydrolase n=1 Tax=Prosthecochloris sp. SCSIO W1103 TaxID=2992244 RepID=UPI00223D3987|nr:linear amide C-N hydrolase [Prosthecochloris sp. SCSIO W1103]UZJ37128.1 linear amide C-N hydrolase [Prosthecochloris sp. SCSIO W1103]
MCTNFSIPVSGEKPVHRVSARTMDFGILFKTVLKKFAVGESFPDGPHAIIHPLKWKAKYGFIGAVVELPVINADVPLPSVSDGMNSAGLSVATLWLPGSEYPRATGTKDNRIWVSDFPSWALGNFATVRDLNAAMDGGAVQIEGVPFLQNKIPLHFMVQDQTGDCLVIEFHSGEVVKTLTDDGLLTNAPFYSEQLENLHQEKYKKLTPRNTEYQYGQETNGSGMLGLPGDATPPSRFVRAAKMCLSVYRPEPGNEQQNISFAWQLLQTIWVPCGTITEMDHPEKMSDFTQWAVIRDYTKKQYYFYSYLNPTLHKIDLQKLDFSRSSDVEVPIIYQDDWFIDATAKFK